MAQPLDLPGILSFWDFQSEAGVDLTAKGPYPYRLRERTGWRWVLSAQ